ncbi:CHAT domain-containing protein [Pseudorhodoferax sp.]|uniref:CHAT domain-containing protein n=1 Tax=Pseudorhodoferax sp. TaxID=1993553 RepID=UPI0039E5D6FB
MERLHVRIVHGGLDYARFPLLIGHHMNEGLSAAGRRVDAKLGGQLQCAIDLKLFVGALRTAQYLRPNNHGAGPPAYAGAVVLGLGAIGELTPTGLAETVTRGVLRYAFEHVYRDPFAAPRGSPCALRLSSVLLGTQLQALATGDALTALLQGVWRADQLIAGMNRSGRQVRLAELEIIEIDESRALDAAYELRRLLNRSEWRERCDWPDGLLETREGATSGYRRHAGTPVWQRLIVRQDTDGGLGFALIGEQARVEATQVQSDVASLRRFIDRVSDDSAAPGDPIERGTDPVLGAVLFQLLLPQPLQSRMTSLDDTVLVVDDTTAAYPWELLTPPPQLSDDDTARPIAVQAGLVRQRVTNEFRQLPRLHTGFRALVIGAPDTGGWLDEHGRPLHFNDLPGARAEAHAVLQLLKDDPSRAWAHNSCIGPPPTAQPAPQASRVGFEQVRVALLKEPVRVLHISAHGVVDQWVRRSGSGADARAVRKTGVVLSDQEVLGAVDVESMSFTPEFVFLNCCYSGRHGEGLVAGQGPRAALASSLALKFIDMGSRAVIATGWQIDDEAALDFARAFYAELLGGRRFGEAVRLARAAVYATHGELTNTWGAFQCYGDPNWRLEGGRQAGGSDVPCLRDAHATVSPGELAARLAQVQATAGGERPEAVAQQLDQLIDRLRGDPLRAAWLQDSRVLAEAGLAYRELGRFETAAGFLQRAARGIGSQMRIGDIDTLVDALVRVGTGPDRPSARAAAQLLEQLDQLGGGDAGRWPLAAHEPELGPSCLSERECLRGALALRAAHAQDGSEGFAHALGVAATAYARAYRIKLAEGDTPDRRAQALSGALLSAALLALLDGPAAARGALQGAAPDARPDAPPDWHGAARQLLRDLGCASACRTTFWQHANGVELRTACGLFAHALGGTTGPPEDDLDIVRGEIRRLLHLWPSPSQLEGTRFRFQLVERIAATLPAGDAAAAAIGTLVREALDLLQPERREIG